MAKVTKITKADSNTKAAKVTLDDVSLKGHNKLSERVKSLKVDYFKAAPEICTDRPKLITKASSKLFNKDRISILDKAKVYREALEKRAAIVQHSIGHYKDENNELQPFSLSDAQQLFAGSTTSKFKGVPLYPEFFALALWPELWTISKREANPYYISEKEVEKLNFDVFPPWMENNILELARKRCFKENLEKYGKEKYAPEIKLLESFVFFITTKPNCISHTIPDFTKAIGDGMSAMIEEAKRKEKETSDSNKKEFYQAISEVLKGIISYSHNLAAEAEKLAANEADPVRKKELEDIAEIHKHVPEKPARTFREGLTTLWICWTAIHFENPNVGLSLGRLDQILYKLYSEDIKHNRLTIDEAIELICCLWLKIGDHVPTVPETGEKLFGGSGSNQAITIGGVDKNGDDAVNDLTYVMLKATELMMLRDPNLNARYYEGVNTKEYLRRLCEVNITTGATPALHNDKAVIESLTGKGETPEQARDYGVIGCVEPGSNGRFYGHTGAILLNLTSALELALFNGRHRHTGMERLISKETGEARNFKTFQEFKNAFEEQTKWLIGQSTNLNNMLGKIHQDYYPTPILSALFEGPMDKGKDLIEGGAVINSSGLAVIGLADVIDSISAIEEFVFEKDDVCSFEELLEAINNNFEGIKALKLQKQILKEGPKYGNGDAKADANAKWVIEMIDDTLDETENYRGGKYRLGCWSMTNHAGFGMLTKALPSGRKYGENFASGITPVSGVTKYLPKTLNSIANLPTKSIANGMAFNIKYTPEPDEKTMLDNFVASVETYFGGKDEKSTGGMEIQFNVKKEKDFEKAKNDPEFLVRVSGYTAYFKDLSPQMQKEIIERSEYLLSSGEAMNYKL
jgi:formate C-acetyltransferase